MQEVGPLLTPLTVHPALTEAQTAALAGTLLGSDAVDLLVRDTATILKPDGSPLVIFRKNYIPGRVCRAAWMNLRDAATPTDNRGIAAGRTDLVALDNDAKVAATGNRTKKIKKDGTISRTTYAARSVNSGVVGYMDRASRFPYCRLTAYSMEHPERFAAALPFFRWADRGFAEFMPERHAAQAAVVARSNPDFTIHNTAFTTVTVNRNWQTAVHQDAGDLREGFGVMSALSAGRYDGCYLCFPKYRVAVDMRAGDLLLADVHEWHGNTPLIPRGAYERISLVLYYREGIQNCGSASEELARAKSRTKGSPLKRNA